MNGVVYAVRAEELFVATEVSWKRVGRNRRSERA
jgi:hypothetical protein